MFFQLDEISRLDRSTADLSKAKQKLDSLIVNAYQEQPTVKNAMSSTISDILEQSVKRSELFAKIQQAALSGYLVPSFLDFQSLTAEKGDLPEWAKVVFQKQFEKQKKSLDVMAKKIYMSHCLTEAKDRHIQQLNSFRNLNDRYTVLSGHDETIDIMAETEKMRNLTRLTNQKFLNYCSAIANRLVVFVEEAAGKFSNFSKELTSWIGKTTNSWRNPDYREEEVRPMERAKPVSNVYDNKTSQTWLTRANRTLQNKNLYRSAHHFQTSIVRQPKWLSSFTNDYYN